MMRRRDGRRGSRRQAVAYTGKEVKGGLVYVVTGDTLLEVAVHVPYNRRLDGNCKVLGDVEIEIEADLGCEVVPVAEAVGLSVIVMTPTGTDEGLDSKRRTPQGYPPKRLKRSAVP